MNMFNIFPQRDFPRIWNTKESGVIEFVIYPADDKYIGVCLTFDIIEEDTDFNRLKNSIEEAAILHLKVVIEKKLPDTLLNRHAPKEYWDKYFEIKKAVEAKNIEKIKGSDICMQVYPNDALVTV